MSENLKIARENAGLTLVELAQKADVSRSTLEKAERGTPIRYAYAAKIVNALNAQAGTNYTVESLGVSTAR